LVLLLALKYKFMSNPEINRDYKTESAKESFRRGLEKIVKPEDLNVLRESCPTNLEKPLELTAENPK
jgi:hypothetical protein